MDHDGKVRARSTTTGWAVSPGLVDYPDALAAMEARAAAIVAGEAGELVWLLEHPPLYTAGASSKPSDLIDSDRLPVFEAGRGGEYTYHGPGQRVAYVMLDLRERGRDVRAFVGALERWIITALEDLGVAGEVRPGRVGVWVEDGDSEQKVAAIGVRLRRWVSFHGIALNVAPNLDDFSGIVPCGIADRGVTSLEALGRGQPMARVDEALRVAFETVFGPVTPASPPVVRELT